MKNLSAGNYALATLCQYWLTDEAEHEKSPTTPAMQFGNAVHKCIEIFLQNDEPLISDIVAIVKLRPSWVPKVERRYHSWLAAYAQSQGVLQPEVSFAYNVETGFARKLHGNGWQKYSDVNRMCEVTLAIDAHAMSEDCVDVYDWKTGRMNEKKDIEQARACALVAARFYNLPMARAHVVYIDDETTTDYREGFALDDFDMASIAGTLRGIFKLEDTEPKPGPHCKSLYCAAQKSCTKKMIGGKL